MSEPTVPVPESTPSLDVTPTPAPKSRSMWLFIVLPVVLMVLSLGGIGATLLYAHHEATVAPTPGSGRFPGGTYTGTRPTNFPNGGNFPSGFPTDGNRSNFPTDMPSGMPTGGFGGNGGTPGTFQRPTGTRPSGGYGNFPGAQANTSNGTMKLSGLQIGLIVGCGVIFVGSAVFLGLSLAGRKKTAAASAPVGSAPNWQSEQATDPVQQAQAPQTDPDPESHIA